MVLWVLGLGFGLALMAAAAWLEYQREGVLQQVRVFGRELGELELTPSSPDFNP